MPLHQDQSTQTTGTNRTAATMKQHASEHHHVSAPTVSAVMAQALRERTDHLFGLMGNGNAHLISALTSTGFPYTSARHEVSAITMADAYFRATGTVAATTTTYGAGFTNALTGLAEARLARIPLVFIVGDQPGTGARFFDINQALAAESLDVPVLDITAQHAADMVHQAFDLAVRDQTPVLVSLPYDLADAPAAPATPATPPAMSTLAPLTPREPLQADPALLAQAAEALVKARRPLILAGRGVVVSHTGRVLGELGDEIGALHMNSLTACNVVDSPANLGIAGGFTRRHVLEIAQQADVVLVAGASLNPFQLRYGQLMTDQAQVFRIDHHPQPSTPLPTQSPAGLVQITADLETALPDLLREVQQLRAQHRADGATQHTWRDEVRPALETLGHHPLEDDRVLGEDGRLNPRVVVDELNRILPAERTVVMDGGHFLGWAPMYVQVPDPTAMIAVGTAFQSIGLGFGSAAGVAVARPERTTVLFTGDGGGLMGLADLETLIRATRVNAGRTVVVALNDAAYGAEIHQYAVKGLDDAAMLIDDVDFSALGRALGADGARLDITGSVSPTGLGVLADWLATHEQGTFVLDVPISQQFVAEYMRESVAAQ